MKSVIYIAFVLTCLISACGGKAEGDHSIDDSGTISSVAGSPQSETGGASSAATSTITWTSAGGTSPISSTATLNNIAGSTFGNATGGSSTVQTTVTPVEQCDDGIDNNSDSLIDCHDPNCIYATNCTATGTGGASNSTAISTGGSSSSTNGSNSTGGSSANITPSTGGSTYGIGGVNSITGSSTAIAGSPAITTGTAIDTTGSNVVDTTLEITTPETPCLKTTKIKLPDDAESNNNRAIGPFCCTGKTMTIRDHENNPIGYVYFYSFPHGNIIGDSFYAPSVDIYVSAAPTYGSNDAQVQSSVSFTIDDMEQGKVKTVSVGALAYTLKITHADILIQGTTKLFNMDTLRAEAVVSLSEKTTCSTLVVSLSKGTPKSKIVLPERISATTAPIFSRWTIKNRSANKIPFLNVLINGTISSLYSEGIFRCDTGTGAGIAASANENHLTSDSSIPSGAGSIDWNIPPYGQIELCLRGSPAIIDGLDGSPKSGDLLYLTLTDVYTNDGIHAVFDGPIEPPKMILRKAKPVVTILPLNQTTISNGVTMELFKFHISSSSDSEPIDVRDFDLLFNISDLDPTNLIDIVNLRLTKDTTEMGFDAVNIGDSKWRNTVSYGGGAISFSFSPNNSIIGNPGITYTVTGTILRAQIGDVVSIGFIRSRATQPFTGYLCKPGSDLSHNIIDTTDYDTCLTKSAGWMDQGGFHWSDMSDPANNKDWTDDFLVESLEGSSVLTY